MRSKSAKETPLYRPRTAFDLLQIPLLGPVLRSRWGRLVLQVPLVTLAVLLVIDGFIGPQVASRNLATVAPWVHYRGLVVLAILLVGNLFCMGCPFTLTRTLGRRLSLRGRRFPRALRNKWVAIAALFVLFFLYEWLDLWASPALTAWLIVAYFAASFVMEAVFTESAFCKYVCPLGTFNFVYSTASPTQIAVKNTDVCASCQGKECVNGSYAAQPLLRVDQIPVQQPDGSVQHEPHPVRRDRSGTLGCGTELFPPQIKSNMDCVYCLDCVRACPHQNIGLFARTPGRELLRPGAWPRRWDLSLLVIALTFMGITNAFGMVPPVYELQQWLVDIAGLRSDFVVLLVIFGVGNLLLPAAAAVGAAWLTRRLASVRLSLRDTVALFAPSFVPLGFGIWIAHYGFHFLIAPLSIIPVFQEFLGQPGEWERFGAALSGDWIGLIQVVALVGGFLWSLIIAQKAALHTYRRQGFIALMPWAFVLLALMLVSAGIFAMPMEMRGTDFLFD